MKTYREVKTSERLPNEGSLYIAKSKSGKLIWISLKAHGEKWIIEYIEYWLEEIPSPEPAIDSKHIDEYYKEWCGESHLTNSCNTVHDSAEACDFAEYYFKQKSIEKLPSEPVDLGLLFATYCDNKTLDGNNENCLSYKAFIKAIDQYQREGKEPVNDKSGFSSIRYTGNQDLKLSDTPTNLNVKPSDDNDYIDWYVAARVDKLSKGKEPKQQNRLMTTPEEKVNDILIDMIGIGGIPSNEEFYAEFDMRLRESLGIKQHEQPSDEDIERAADKYSQVPIIWNAYQQGAKDLRDGKI